MQIREFKVGAIRQDPAPAVQALPQTTQRHGSSLAIRENAEYRDALGRVMKVISIEGDMVYYGIRGECLFRPLKASLHQFTSLAGLETNYGHLRLVVNAG